MSKKLVVELVGETGSFNRAFDGAGKSALSFGNILKAGIGLELVHKGVEAVSGLLHAGIGEWTESTKVAAQTGAVLKSTGGIAHVTAKGVDTLATSLMRKSGVDDEAIKSGENMLLTFGKIRNESGAGNDVFNQSTKAVLDMTTAMTHGNVTAENLSKTSILVGKALNDPIKGATALRRVGVALDETQKAQIASMMKHGDVMGAQKIILGELNKEFGGSADAMGKTLPGQIAILKESFNNLSGDLVGKLMPSFQMLVTWVSAHMPEIEAVFKKVADRIGQAITGLVIPTIKTLITTGQGLLAFYEHHRTLVQSVVVGLGTMVVVMKTITIATKAWAEAQVLLNLAMAANPYVIAAVAIIAIGAALIYAYRHSETFRNIVQGAMRAVVNAFDAVKDAAVKVIRAFERIGAAIGGFASTVYNDALSIGRAIVDGVLNGVGGLYDALKGKLESTLKGVLTSLNPFSPVSHGGEIHIGRPLAEGAIKGWIDGSAQLPAKMKESIRRAVEVAKQSVDSARSVLSTAFSRLSGDALAAFDARAGHAMTPAGKALAALTGRHDEANFQRDLASARSGLSDAQTAAASYKSAEGDTPEQIAAAQKQLGQAVLDAQHQIDELLYSQERSSLERRAAQEQLNLDAKTTLRRRHFEDALGALGTSLEAEGATVGTAHSKVLSILAAFGVNFKNVGHDMGKAWVAGLKESIGGAAKGAGKLSDTITHAAAAIHSGRRIQALAGGGSMFAGELALVGERGPELFVPNVGGRIVPNGRFGGGVGGGEVVIPVTVNLNGEPIYRDVQKRAALDIRGGGKGLKG